MIKLNSISLFVLIYSNIENISSIYVIPIHCLNIILYMVCLNIILYIVCLNIINCAQMCQL